MGIMCTTDVTESFSIGKVEVNKNSERYITNKLDLNVHQEENLLAVLIARKAYRENKPNNKKHN